MDIYFTLSAKVIYLTSVAILGEIFMKILCLTHADFEGPGIIEAWAQQHQYDFKICRPYQGDNCLKPIDFDFLVIMGGPQSPISIDQSPYLKDEILLIQQAVAKNKIILGFCLGAQLIGEALGAKTSRSPFKEIGVFPINLTTSGKEDPLFLDFPSSFPVIHWHNDMPGETKESVLLASSEGCPKQILRYSPYIYGFQCHLEITKAGIQDLIEACHGDLKPSQFVQTTEELLKQNYSPINSFMIKILDRLVSLKYNREAA